MELNDTRYHRSQATLSTLSKVFYTPGGPERFVEFCSLLSLGCSCGGLLICVDVLRAWIKPALDMCGSRVCFTMACLSSGLVSPSDDVAGG